ncbi:rhodanese-like domain-containing protein [Paraflavisolibacter sp. H34]|uniref:rhodanese-like domain-containing protein n=1 Tax=Huijunlia imazamoxiresistens TaxID=3127457 RepID=UPI003017A7E2
MRTLILAGCVFLLLYITYRTYRSVKLGKGLDRLLADGAVLLDVRTEGEYAAGHLPGSLNISLGTIRERYTELDPGKTYITYCSHGLRSVKAQSLLQERGFKNVYNGGALPDLEKIIKALS